MADVGVLNLQIQADASQAATSLKSLATALTRVKEAVGKGLSFGQLPTQLKKLSEALGGNWSGSEQFKTAMTNLKDGANIIAKANVGEKLEKDAKGINAWVNAYQKVISTLNSVKKNDNVSSKVANTVNSITSGTPQSASTLSSAMFGGRFAQHFYALNDPDSGYGKTISNIKSQTEAVATSVTTNGEKIKNAVSSSAEAMKSGVPADAASGFKEMSNTLKQMDAGTIQNITNLASALKELKGLGGIGANLKSIAEGIAALAGATKNAEALASAIRIDASAINRMKSVCDGFKLPSFNNLIKLAESMQANPAASVYMKRIADSIEALKAAGSGFKMPNVSGIEKVATALANTKTADASASSGMQKVSSAVDETVGKMEQLGSVTDTNGVSGQITELFAKLNSPIDYSKLSGFVDQMAGIGQSANVTKQELDVFATDSAQKIDTLIQQLNAPVSYKGLKEFVDFMNGGGRGFKSSEQDWEALFKIGEGAESANKQLVAMQQAVDNVTGSYMRLEVAGQQAMYVPRTPEDVKAARDDAMSRMSDNQARREAVWSSETSDNMRNAQAQIYAVKSAADQATQSVQNLNNAANTQNGGPVNQMVPNTGAIDGASQSIANYADTIRNVDTAVNSMSSDQARMISEATSLENQINSLADSELIMRDNLVQDIQAGRLDANQIAERVAQIRLLQTEQANLYTQLVEMEHAQRISTRAMNALKGAFQNLRDGMSKLPFVGLIKQMMRMARMRALRYMIRELAKGFREGVENVYHYSEAIGGSFHESMDSAATALNQMKNSIGAAVAPALQALIPLFNTIVGWITTAVNYLNQFFSLLSGKSTWTRALPVATKAFDEQKKAAKGASDSVKDMLADFDELNIIQQQGGGGGSGGSGSDTNYAEMFEEVSEFDGKIKDMVGWIEDHMETVEGIAKAIGIAILGWKISNAFSGVLGTLGGIIAGGAVLAIGLQIAYEGAYSAGLNGGFDTESLLATIAGNVAAAVGGGIIGFKLAGPKGAVVGALIGLTIGIVTSIVAYKKGQSMAEEIARFGTIAMDAAQLRQSIENMYSFDISAKIQLIGTTIENAEQARARLSADATTLGTKIRKVIIGVRIGGASNSQSELEELRNQCNQVVADMNEYLITSSEGIHLLVKDIRIAGADGTDITDNILTNVSESDRLIMGYMRKLGEDVAKAFDDGMKSNWANGESDLMLELAGRMERITTGAQELQLQMEYEAAQLDILNGQDLSKLDRDSLIELMNQLNQLEEEYTGKYVDIQKVSRSGMLSRASTLQRIAEDMDANDPRKQEYIDLANTLRTEAFAMTESVMKEIAEGKFGVGSKNQELRRSIAEALRSSYYNSNAWESYVVDILKEYDEAEDATSAYALGAGVRQAQSGLNANNPKIQDVVDGINQIIVDALPTNTQQVLGKYIEAGGSLFDILPGQSQRSTFKYLTDRAGGIFTDPQEQQDFVDSIMLKLYNGDKLRYAQLLESIGQSPWGMYRNALPSAVNGDVVDQTYIESIFTDAAENLASSGLDLYNYVKDKYGNTTLAAIVDAINSATEATGQTREDIYRLMFGDDYVQYMGRNNGGVSGARRPPLAGYGNVMGGAGISDVGPRTLFVNPNAEWEERNTDNRTATATEGTQQQLVTQNDKIDRVERLLTAVLSRLNAGLNVKMAPTSTGGRMVNGMLDAFSRVTGNN